MSSKKKPTTVEELHTGYLFKSPPPSSLTKSIKLWKHYFFVLSKTSEDTYQLTYYANQERRDKPLKVIDISKIILLFIGPEAHQKWEWIQKNLKCSPSSVLFFKVEEDSSKHARDYFLIGENSDVVNGWFCALFEIMKTQQLQNTLQDDRFRSASQPIRMDFPKFKGRWSVSSAPELTCSSHYRNELSERPVPIPVMENTYVKDRKQDESPKNSVVNMSMTSVEDHNHSKQSVSLNGNRASAELDYRQSMTSTSEDILLDCATKAFNDMKTTETFTESNARRNFKQSISITGSCASTEMDNSETHTRVENEMCCSQNDLENSLISTQEEAKPCVSQRRQGQDSRGDWILPQDAVEGIQKCLKRLSRDEAKLLLRRYPGLIPYPVYHT